MSTIQLPNVTHSLLLNNQQSTLNKTLYYFLAHHANRALDICTACLSLADRGLVPGRLQHIANIRLLLHPTTFANIGSDPPNNAAAPHLSETPREETWAEHDYKQRWHE
ncbi:hypothetical protein KSC_002720 [Ktedonobacter sp. SOSP1-52]|uniref:hypothetical protein n=1 Tax=Ktedonobacter sp. SOSP1-52 TaxID=2778366 RepID=UPI00191610E3|nr:hypothetical protein [Ktedonobacter sp. SOSP1-52]GHO61380.1 hypothetical protein KSC_002720 [Ktedonobacter sp. SOSP1-52]